MFMRAAATSSAMTLVVTGAVGIAPEKPKVESRKVALASAPAEVLRKGWSRTITLDEPAEMAGFDWNGKTEGAMSLRVKDSDGWRDWVTLHANPDEGPDPSSIEYNQDSSTPPVWIGRGVEQIQVRVEEGDLRDAKMTLIHSPTPRASSLDQAQAFPAQPRIYSRGEWAADESWRSVSTGCDGNPSYAASLRNAFVHHTVSANTYTAEEVPAMLRGIYQYHVFGNGWCDIGYNFLIDRFGRVFEGRAGGIDRAVIGAHSGGFNTGSTGIALMGTHTSTQVPSSTRSSLHSLLAWKFMYHGVDARQRIQVTSGGSTRYAAGTVVALDTISGHRDVSLTQCPGDLAYPLLPGLRPEVQATMMATPPYPLPGWTPAASGPGLLVLDGYGGLHPAGSQQAMGSGGFWWWMIARGVVSGRIGGYVVDGYGALHPFGGAAPRVNSGYWSGWDIVRGVTHGPVDGSGWVLDAYGGLHPYGGAPLLADGPYWNGWDIARGVAATPTGTGGYLLDGFGGVHPFGTAPAVTATGYWNGWDIARAIAVRPDGQSGYVLDGFGGLHPFGGAPRLSGDTYIGRDASRALVLTEDGDGGWVVDSEGFVRTFGNAPPLKTSLTWTGLGATRGAVLSP